ncbi:AMP-dependent synthetase/ligase [Actinocorallia sp. A-T 12471]|uniref:AMP-dependent synthetase/ligase n=1 Tax=Actinocorallia sp. A-T 12471 TaxID=3089813 RepID=UPI0029D3ECC7|nr:AMP-dependent synthetase/ligase [Actinocorallia sp. A-T 12471]MDX6743190.1 AMP-dependent synthetase/ligase [Actinocorallia sp. A-T 12471]
MREYTAPALVEVPASATTTDTVFERAARDPRKIAFRRPDGKGSWRPVSIGEFRDQVVAVAKGLIALGVQPGDRVGLLSRNRYEWTVVDYAIWTAGAVTVPIYETSSVEQITWILSDSGAVGVFTENSTHKASVKEAGGERVWVIEDGGLDELAEAGADVTDELLEERRTSRGLADLATLIYTSGTTGRPKGCELTHGNFVELCRNGRVGELDEILGDSQGSTLLFIPLAHVFARMIQVLVIESGVVLGHSPDIKNLLEDLGSFKPSFLLAVPRVFEKVYNGAEQKAIAGGKGKIFAKAAETSIAYSRALDAPGGPGLGLKVKHAVFDKLVYAKLREAVGGNVSHAVSGGAALGERLGHFFRGVGITILEGYGLTETTAPLSVNTPRHIKIGSVGRPMPGSSVKIGDDGEVLAKGVGVLRGYWNNEAATKEAIEDGWFRTGDLGSLDEDGFLSITGRKKEILVTAGGKNVAPAPLEDRVRAHPLVSQCLVVGEGQRFVAALVTLDPEAIEPWQRSNGLEGKSIAELAEEPKVIAEIAKAVDGANLSVSHAEQIKKFKILDDDFTVENDYLTPSLKVKRHLVVTAFAGVIEEIYR